MDPEWLAILSVFDDFYQEYGQKQRFLAFSQKNPYVLDRLDCTKAFESSRILEKIRESKEKFEKMGDLELKFVESLSSHGEIQEQTRILLDLLGLKREKYRNFLYFREKSEKLPEKSANLEEIPLNLSSPEEKKEEIPQKPGASQISLGDLPFFIKPSP